jgi:PAS domain S-box-containing protein
MSRILVVDDHEQNRYLLRTVLEARGDEVQEGANGVEALEEARLRPPDLIISDILMPQMDGFALCRECKNDEHLRHVPFVFYTATYTDPRDEALARQLGAARFIVKPVETEDFVAILREVLQERADGLLTAPDIPPAEETVLFRLYNEALIRKLEDKMIELERLNGRLAESEERFRRLAESAPDLIYRYELTAPRGFSYVSPAATELTGYTPAEHYADPDLLWRLMHPDDRPQQAAWQSPPTSREPQSMRWVRKDGQTIWIEQRRVSVHNEAGDTVAIEGIARDISARQQAEEQVQRQVQRLAALRAVDLAITNSLDLRVVLNIVLEQAMAQLGVAAASILLLQPHSTILTFAAGRGFRTHIAEGLRLHLGESFAGQAALERRLVEVHEVAQSGQSGHFAALWASEGFAAYYGVPLVAKGQMQGVLEVFQRVPFAAEDDWRNFLETLAGQAAIAVDSARLFEDLQRSNLDLSLAYDATIEGWSRALDLRDKETEGHTRRVTEWTERLGRAMGIRDSELLQMRRGALLHDIGKMGLPDSVLLKPGQLTDEEWVLMRQHPQLAFEMLSPIGYLRPALSIPGCHHEKWDGTGYPRGLKGEQIPLEARIFAVVDVWDALTSDRPYRKAWTVEQALHYIREQAGHHFDPQAVELFLRVLNDDSKTSV